MTLSYRHGFLPQLEGLRGVAASGVLATHVAFQTGLGQDSALGAILARFDYFVAIFFALSAFLLWRGYRREGYYLRRARRILPAYLVCVALTFGFFPEAFGAPAATVLANLSFTSIYVPNALWPGLTHLWSLAVEVAFYLALPGIVWLARRQPLPVFAGLAAAGFGWTLLPFPDGPVNFQIFPFSYLPWFAVGLAAAELEGRVHLPAWTRLIGWPLGIALCWVAAQPWYGPPGLIHPSPGEFFLRILAGTAFCAVVFLPYALGGGGGLLETTPMQKLGRWSYSLFLWHVPVLGLVFPLLGIAPFSGHFWLVLSCTFILSVVVAYVSYELVESPFLGKARMKSAAESTPASRIESPA